MSGGGQLIVLTLVMEILAIAELILQRAIFATSDVMTAPASRVHFQYTFSKKSMFILLSVYNARAEISQVAQLKHMLGTENTEQKTR